MKMVKAVAAVIVKDGLIFCCRRKDYGECAKKWEFPGGKIEVGETPEQALIREIKEELDSEISVDSYITRIEHDYKSFHLSLIVYYCTLQTGDLELKEHLEKKFVKKEDLASIDFADADKKVLICL